MKSNSFVVAISAVALAAFGLKVSAQEVTTTGLGSDIRPWQPSSWIETPVESSDKPCALDLLEVSARVNGVFARVSTEMTIRNPNSRPISADIVFPMPDGAVVCGYALDVGGAMVDGVVVPKEKARVAFETEQRRGVDPGLVEAVKGNVYRTRVYPVPANGVRKVRIDWTSPVQIGTDGTSAAISLPMPGVALKRRKVEIEVADTSVYGPPQLGGFGDRRFERAERFWRVSGEENDVPPRSDLLIALPVLPAQLVSTERNQDGEVWFCASVVPTSAVPTVVDTGMPESWTLAWDASGSRDGANHATEFALLKALGLGARGPFNLVVFRNTPEPMQRFDDIDSLIASLEKIEYDGGTDFASLADSLRGVTGEIFVFTDGIDTLSGDRQPGFDKITGARVTAFVSGSARDVEALRSCCGGRVFDPADGLAATIGATKRFVSSAAGDGVSDVQGIGSDATRRATVFGRVRAGETGVAILRLDIGGEQITLEIKAKDAVLGRTLATAWAASWTKELETKSANGSDEALLLARKYGIVGADTSILVLETLSQWLAHDIEPPESMPEMRREWLAAKKNNSSWESPEAKAAKHLEAVSAKWKQRMAWWETDYSKATGIPKTAGSSFNGSAAAEPRANGVSLRHRIRSAFMSGRAEVRENTVAAADFEADGMVASEAPAMLSAGEESVAKQKQASDSGRTTGTIAVKPWSPDVPYLKALDKSVTGDGSSESSSSTDAARISYLESRKEWFSSPGFFLDCAGWFFDHGDTFFAVRVLSNLAEMRIEDPALLRVMAWRLKQARAYRECIIALRRVCAMREEEAQSWRDLALALDEAGRAAFASGDPSAPEMIGEALELFRKVALTPWNRRALALAIVAVEEHNALRDWAQENMPERTSEWTDLPEALHGVPACDLRVVMSWDADETDVDIHVTEPNGEEAFYGNRRTVKGGDVSEDITDGYGPEEYMIRKAPAGRYLIRAHYFASHQQAVFGPATVTATVFSDWGRAGQTFETASVRLDKAREMVEVGSATVAGSSGAEDPK